MSRGLCRKVDRDAGTGNLGTWRLGEVGTWGRGDVGTWGRGDVGTWGRKDVRTWGRGDVGMRGRGDAWTWGCVNVGTSGLGDAATHFRSREFQKWENIPKKVELLMLFCKNDQLYTFQIPAKYTSKFKNWILKKSFSPPVTELDFETKQKT